MRVRRTGSSRFRAMADGAISPSLPFVKKKSVELLKAEYTDRESAARGIARGLADFYRGQYPQVYANHRSQVEAAAQQLVAIWGRNVFPEMKVGWGTYPNNLGHDDFIGCFRCHDDNHKAADGRTITQDCSACHTVLAQEETNPKVLADLGLQ